MSFPGALPSYTAPTAGETLQAGGHTALHIAEETDIIALGTKIGTGSSTPTSGLLLRGNGAGTSAWAQVGLTTDVTGVLPIANGGTGNTSGTYTPAQIDSFISAAKQALYPVGCIYTEITGTNPNTTFGFGVWSQFGQGQVLVGQKNADTNFGTVLNTGGEVNHTLTIPEMPAHAHTPSERYLSPDVNAGTASASGAATWSADTATTSSTGGGGSHNNLQPFITVYFWRRTS